jgi:hypothetical protein
MYHLVDAYAIYAITAVGGTHVLLPGWDVREALELLARRRVTATHVAATMLQMLITNPQRAALDLSRVRLLSCGGSALPTALVAQAFACFGAAFFTSYGMTECCGKISVSRLTREKLLLPLEEQLRLVGSQGRTFPTVELCIAKDFGSGASGDTAVAAGEVGEVRIRGGSVLREYWQRPDATAASFIDGWFCTGDLGALDGHGWLTLVDRKKDMILFAGENVYSAEVERVVMSHPAVALGAVYGVPDPSGQFGELVKASGLPPQTQPCVASVLACLRPRLPPRRWSSSSPAARWTSAASWRTGAGRETWPGRAQDGALWLSHRSFKGSGCSFAPQSDASAARMLVAAFRARVSVHPRDASLAFPSPQALRREPRPVQAASPRRFRRRYPAHWLREGRQGCAQGA